MPVLILLAIVWAIVLVPPFVRNRSELRPGSSVSSFRQDLAVIGRTTPGAAGPGSRLRPPVVPGSRPGPAASGDALPGTPTGRAAARKRRRDVLFTLTGVAGFTFLLALAFGGSMVLLQVAVDVVLAGYVYLLVQMRRMAEEQAIKVRPLATSPTTQRHLVVVRRSATG